MRAWIRDNGGHEGMGRALLCGDVTRAAAAAAATRGRRADGDEVGLELSGGGGRDGGGEGEDTGGSERRDSRVSSSSGGGGGGGVGAWETGRPTVCRAGRLTLDTLLSLGRSLEEEQEHVMRVRLVEEYMKAGQRLKRRYLRAHMDTYFRPCPKLQMGT